jgi:hypothetical protein
VKLIKEQKSVSWRGRPCEIVASPANRREHLDTDVPATDPELTLRSFVESEGMGLGTAFFLGRTHRKGPFMVVAEIQV